MPTNLVLNEQNRQRLDGIVQKMVANKEPDQNIQTVVSDFKSKYGTADGAPPAPATTPPPTIAPPRSVFGRAKDAVADFAIGAAKGVADLPREAASLGNDLADKFAQTKVGQASGKLVRSTLGRVVSPETAQQLKQGLEEGTEQTSFTKPKNTAQKAGFATEKVAELFVPAGAATKVAKVVKEAKILSKAPRVASVLGRGAQVLAEGAVNAGQTALQEGELNEKAAVAGATGAGLSVASEAVNALSKVVPETMWSNILKRTSKEIERKPNLEKEVSKTGMFGTRKQILNTAKERIQDAELQLDELLKKSDKAVETKNIVPYLEDLKTSYNNIPGENEAVNTIQKLQEEMAQKGTLTPTEANNLKREIYKKISSSYGKGVLEIPAKSEAQKQIARGLKEEIEKIVPEAKNINERQAIYLQVKKAIERQVNKPRSGIAGSGVGLYDLILGGAGTAAGGGVLGVQMIAGKKVAESDLVKSSVAKMFNYFNELSPTKRALFYNALKGLSVRGGVEAQTDEK